jgi:hypothetical protein
MKKSRHDGKKESSQKTTLSNSGKIAPFAIINHQRNPKQH